MSLKTQQDAIEDILQSVEVSSSAVFHEVKTAPPRQGEEFTGYPSAYFAFRQNESDYSTNEEHRRMYNWTIVIESFTQSLTTEQHYEKMYGIMDSTVQAFDENSDLNGAVDFITPVPSSVLILEGSEGYTLIGEINLRVWQDVDVRV